MAQPSGARGRVATWPAAGMPAPWLSSLPGLAGPMAARLRQWAALEVAPGRLTPWIPVAFGAGVAVYFAADREPAWWAALALAVAASAAAWALRASPAGFPVAVGCAAVAAGMAAAAIKSRLVDHTVLLTPAYSVSVQGFVEAREERERSDRIVVRVTELEAARLAERPERVRLTVRKGTAPAVGAFIAMKARLNPPASPFRPGGYDLARDLYFQKIGATGLALGRIDVLPPPAARGAWLEFAAFVEGIRDGIDGRIRSAVKGDAGSIASALITGKRDALSAPVFDAMYISGVGHVLSVSGYHMAVVAGVVFFIVRAALALFSTLALGRPIKKWAAAAAFVAATAYLVLSGAEVATQRSYIMTAVVLMGVMADRPVLTLRTIALAALAVMAIAPEAVVHPSFQMSFAATLALIAACEHGIAWTATAATPLAARIALWGVREIAVLAVASLVAGLATTPYAAYHFHRMAPYGVIANLLAMPVISAVAMPAGLLALLAMPFGLDAPLWRLMGAGIDWMVAVAMWVAGLPGAVGHTAAFGASAMLLATAGLIVACLLRSPLRFLGAGLALMGGAAAMTGGRPDVMISAGGDVVAVRGGDGRLAAVKFGNDTLSVREWLAADGDARDPADSAVKAGFACDPDGCVAKLPDGAVVAVSRTAAAFADDCARAALIVTVRVAPADCAARVIIDRATLRKNGAIALTWRDGRFEIAAARPDGIERPWTRHRETGHNAMTQGVTASTARAAPRDATPLQPDIDAER